ncbi:hypothetical protein EH223_06700 [candidate division KSB1 bacterium]|nr:hypothetical protein [candidate division KSB1 bacterium]RQW04841.1 MAG: hypothetical protein EH223_06700 [candidate division KSB1 bacterium]
MNLKNVCSAITMFLLFACVEKPQFHIGQTYMQHHKIGLPHANALDVDQRDNQRTVQGVYWPHFYATKKYPAIVYPDLQNQLEFVLLSDSLDVPFGDVVRISGAPFDTVLELGYSYTRKVTFFRAQHFTIVHDTHTLLPLAQRAYQHYKDELKDQAAQPGSKLNWPEKPEWQLFVDERRSKAIVYFSDADLMYAVDVNLVYDLLHRTLEDIFAHEWFKGE